MYMHLIRYCRPHSNWASHVLWLTHLQLFQVDVAVVALMEIQVLTIPVKSTISVRMGGCVWCVCAGGTSIQVCTGTCFLTQSEYQQTETDRQTGQGTHTHTVT